MYHRHSIRLPGYDYAQNGYYFVTLCVQNRETLFGSIDKQHMLLSPAGLMVDKVWIEIPLHDPGCRIDTFQIMPNHFHAIVVIDHNVGAGPRACPKHQLGQPQGVAPTSSISLPDIISRFKSFTQHQYGLGVKDQYWPMFHKRLWQRNYYEHIIRNEQDYWAIKRYIQDNPKNWENDDLNIPAAIDNT